MAIAGIGCAFQKLYSTGTEIPADRNPFTVSGVGKWADVGEVMSVDGPSPERDTYDTTTINTRGNYRTFIPGLKDGGEVSLEMNYSPESYQEFKDDFDKENQQSVLWYSVVFNDNSDEESKRCIVFEGMVTSVGASIPTDDKVSSNCSIKVSGNPIYTTVGDRNNTSPLSDGRTISLPGGNTLIWRGFLESIVETTEKTSFILPSAFGGNGNAITYSVPTISTAATVPTGKIDDAHLSFVAGTRTLSIHSGLSTGDHPIVYTATDGTTTIKQGIVVTAL